MVATTDPATVIDWVHDPLVRPALPIPLPDPLPGITPPDRHRLVARMRQLQATFRAVLQVEVGDDTAD